MNEYEQQALDFLKSSNATIDIKLVGRTRNKNWNEKELRNLYDFTIKTPRGEMTGEFWDSIHDTEIYYMTKEEYAKKRFRCEFRYLTPGDQNKVHKELKEKKAKAVPTTYSILSCLTTYNPGTFKDFCIDFGYSDDSISALKIYHAVQEEWNNLCRIFTLEQLEQLAEIQ